MPCGRRFGKTLGVSNECLKHALEHNGSLILWVAPTYRQTQIAFRLVSRAVKAALAASPNKSELRLELINDSVIQFASAERYDNLRGEGVDFLIMDETAKIDERAWTEALRPTLSDTGGRAIFIGTPQGRNWFWRLFQRGLDPLEEDWASFTFPTSANPYVPIEEIEKARKDLPEDKFKQEYEAAFLEESAGVFKNIDACVAGGIADPLPSISYIIGWDPAKYEDFSVITVLNLDAMHVDYWERFNRIDYDFQFDRVEDVSKLYNHAPVEMDATGLGDPLMEQLRKRDLSVNGVKFTNERKEQYVRNLSVFLQRRLVTFPYLPVLVNELKNFEYHFTDERNVKYGAPHGEHDDTITSLMLACWKAQDKGEIPMAGATSSSIAEAPLLENLDAATERRQKQMADALHYIQTFSLPR